MTATTTQPRWCQLALTVHEAQAETLSDWLETQGALSVSLDDAGDQPLFEPPPGTTPLWQLTRVTALFDGSTDVDAIARQAQERFRDQIVACSIDGLQDQVWERAWMDHFQPMRFGPRLWICPTGFEPPDPAAVNVILDPGLAFGTGTHPTTALCLQWLDGLDLNGTTILDYGCGSGILAVAALRLGAASAHGIDIDPQALTASHDNAQKNGVEAALSLGYPQDPPGQPADVVLANILAGPLVELSADILSRLRSGGRLALSGILQDQSEQVMAAYAPHIHFDPPATHDGWARLTGIKQ